MNYFSFEKFILIHFILCLLLKKIYSTDCKTNSFNYLSYPKSKTLSNGYHIMISSEGIYSLTPKLTKIAHSYTFTESQKFGVDDIHKVKNTINQVEISQYSDEEEGKKYVIIYANNYIYLLNEYGKVKYFQELDDKIETDNSITLVAYKYQDNIYYFILAHNEINSSNQKITSFYYYKIIKKNEITLIYKEQQTYSDTLSLRGVSCQAMLNSNLQKNLVCFINLKSYGTYNSIAISFNPDINCNYISISINTIVDSDGAEVHYYKTEVNSDRKKALICYSIDSPKRVKCFTYDSIENSLGDVFYNTDKCDTNLFGFNDYYFEQSNEYIISCIDNTKSKFNMHRINCDFALINDEDNTFEEKSFDNCYTLYFFSIIYISQYNQYSVILQANCQLGTFIRIFMMSNSICILPTNEPEETVIEEPIETTIITTIITTIPETTIITTIPETTIITTIPKTTIITTIPKTTIITTIPKTTIITTIPETTIITTIPETTIITTIPATTIITTIPLIRTTMPIIEATNINTTILDIETEINCEDNNKIYYNGKCICNMDKGFYFFNLKSFNNNNKNKCYNKNELPKNIYFNNLTFSYELCYKTCRTCEEEGNELDNNCLTCIFNYIKEQKKNTNCVPDCKYLFYYDSFNQYICTEDEQCPNDASLIVRIKDKCVNKCSNDDTNKYQYNGECLSSCPLNTEAKNYNICQISDISICSTSDYILNLEENINQENVLIAAKNYANEFYYTINHITRFLSENFTLVLYKNSSCVDTLNLNTTKIEYDSCIQQLKKDNDIEQNKEIIVAVIDIVSGDNPITSFGFFDSESGEKLDASKSCSDKNVIMYESILNLLNDPTALKLLQEQKINIFDLNDKFYRDICFHFESPNGKDATLQDRIRTFFPNITLCDEGCKNKGINISTLRAECECTFQDLLSNDLFNNDIIGDNVLIKETLKELIEMASNLNLEVLTCYKDVFSFKYFKKNIGGFIILILILSQIISFLYFYLISYKLLIRYMYSLTEKYIISKKTNKLNSNNNNNNNKIIKNPPKKKDEKATNKLHERSTKKNNTKRNKSKEKAKNKKEKENEYKKYRNISKIKEKVKICRTDYKTKDKKDKKDEKENKNNKNSKKKRIIKEKEKNKNTKVLILKKTKDKKKDSKLKFKNNNNNNKLFMKTSFNEPKNSMEYLIGINQSSYYLNKYKNKEKLFNKYKNEKEYKAYNKKNNSKKFDYILNKSDVDIENFLMPSYDDMDYDDVIEEDKRTFCQYYCHKIKKNQMIINFFFITEIIKPKSIKITVFILNIDLYFLINGLFFNDSYISEIFNSTKKETILSFIPRSIGRFVYSVLIGNLVMHIVRFFFVEEFRVKKILLKKGEKYLTLRCEMFEILKSIIKRIKIFTVISFIIIIFSWYYISCLNNVYPKIRNEWIISSIFLIIIIQILPFITSFLAASIRYIGIKCESEKLFKLSLLFS